MSAAPQLADKLLTAVSRVGLGLGGLGILSSFCLYDVDGGERVVMFNKFSGVEDKVRAEGTHLKIPWVMEPKFYNIRLRPKLIQTTTGTRDLQTVTIHVRMLFKPTVSGLPEIHKTLGEDYDERVLPSIANEVMKATIAQYNAEQLLTLREQVSKEIREAIVARANQFNILMDDVSITHLTYGKEFARAIEEKQVAQQEAERQKFIVERAEQERQATVIRSEGEAEAAKMISEALREHGTGLIEVRRIDAAKEIAEALAKSPNVMYLPAGQQMLLNVSGAGGQRQA
uniref:Prohibitin n=1 Tax=Strombidinopsis acuminata TaxID=141414 RepID=A0A7S3VXA9_9SPIT|mmetsp:Transcript_104242/g.144245  ORF Transcript_104242/g.144245 Transcript_104242/m.144245 type:complete len:286 (+) Transcript_104242:1-858(+)